MSEARFALIIRPDCSFDVIDWPAELAAGLNTLAREFTTTRIAEFRLWQDLSLWTDSYATHETAPINCAVTGVHCALGYDSENYYGPAAFTGGLTCTADGTHSGLTLKECHELLKLTGIDVPTMPKPRTK
ncbi:hypothetical protein [Streptomyces sp. IBSBF 3010]|uniref:hypothetical protein n=1 Tax=Streptomyces sp. IBSBF 3010 TaxID=2903526 RepID=UPI002FDC51D0